MSGKQPEISQETLPSHKLEQFIALLNRQYSGLGNLLKTLDHTVTCEDKSICIRAHYLPFRSGKPITGELIDIVRRYLTHFALPRAEIEEAHAEAALLNPDDRLLKYNELRDRAADLFIKTQKNTDRSGEAGELILYLLIEWILEAPQLLAKMSLKTSEQMPVHGSDGIHLKYDATNDTAIFLWGEAKLHQTIGSALGSAVTSVSDALKYDKMKTDIKLVQRHFSLLGLPEEARKPLLSYLDPLDDNYLKRVDVSACLIGFDFAKFKESAASKDGELEQDFCKALEAQLITSAADLTSKLKTAGISHHRMEIFFLPLPSVSDFRDEFQNAIGWKK